MIEFPEVSEVVNSSMPELVIENITNLSTNLSTNLIDSGGACSYYCTNMFVNEYNSGLVSATSTYSTIVTILFASLILNGIIRALLTRVYSNKICSIDANKYGTRKILLKIESILFIVALGMSVFLFMWSMGYTGIEIA